MSRPPQTLDELGDSLNLWEQLNNDQPNIEAKFHPLYDQFAIMEKYEVAIPEDVQQMLNDLSGEWVNFQQTLIDADAMLKKNKASQIFFSLIYLRDVVQSFGKIRYLVSVQDSLAPLPPLSILYGFSHFM